MIVALLVICVACQREAPASTPTPLEPTKPPPSSVLPTTSPPSTTASPSPPLFETTTTATAGVFDRSGTATPAVPGYNPTPTTETPPMTDLPIEIAAQLPHSIYVLVEDPKTHYNGLWRISKETRDAVRISSTDVHVVDFDVLPTDGSLVYSTSGEELHILPPDSQTTIITQVAPASGDYQISGIAWSPDGAMLAYVVQYSHGILVDESAEREIERQSGLWVRNVETGTVHHINSLDYQTDESEITQGYLYRHPQWSPDGKGILVHVVYYEGVDIGRFYPLNLNSTEIDLRLIDKKIMGFGAWSLDSQSILLSGRGMSAISSLYHVRRENLTQTTLINAEDSGVYVFDAQEIPSGMVFFMTDDDSSETHMYLGELNGTTFSYQSAGPDRVFCPWHMTDWDMDTEIALIHCDLMDTDVLDVVSLDGSVDHSLIGFVEGVIGENVISAQWDAD